MRSASLELSSNKRTRILLYISRFIAYGWPGPIQRLPLIAPAAKAETIARREHHNISGSKVHRARAGAGPEMRPSRKRRRGGGWMPRSARQAVFSGTVRGKEAFPAN